MSSFFSNTPSQAGSNQQTNIFGNPGATGANPPASSIFGNTGGANTNAAASTSGAGGGAAGPQQSSIFGTPNAQTGQQATSIFGTPSNQPTPSPFSTPSAQFGQPATSVFGASSSQTGQPTSSIFGTPSAPSGQPTTSIFGTANTQSGQPVTSVFGASSTQTGQPTSSIFGTPNAPSGQPATSIFGTGNTQSGQPATSIFSTPGAQSGQPVVSSIFGAANAQPAPFSGGSNATTTPAPNPLFGGKTPANLFGTTTPATSNTISTPFTLPKPGDQTPAATKAASASTPAAGAATGGLFGSSTPSSTPALGGNIFSGGGLFGKKPDASAPAAGTTSTPAPAPPSTAGTATTTPSAGLGGLFSGTNASKDKPADKPAAAPTTFNLFDVNKGIAGEKKDDASGTSTSKEGEKPKDLASAPPLGSSFLGAPPQIKSAPAPPGASALSTAVTTVPTLGMSALGPSAVPVAVPPPSMLRGKTIEEIVNKWSIDLDNQVREFNNYAVEVAVWDRALIENGNSLATLYGHVLAAEREQNEIDQTIEHIEQQQKELSTILDTYEKSAEEIMGQQGGALRALDTGPADAERDKNFMLATELHTHLDDLSTSLTQMIEAVNELSLPSSSDVSSPGDDPMVQISQVLSNHLESLQWIDGAVRELESKVNDVEKRIKDSGAANSAQAGVASKARSFGAR